MRGIVALLGVGLLAGLVALGGVARADDKAKPAEKPQKIAPDKLPEKVMAAIKARLPGAEITSAEKEMENGKVVFDIELKHKGRKYEMDIQEDGTIIEIEKEVAAKDVPAVTKAVTAKYPNATIKEIMEVNKVKGKQETPIHYEVTITTADKKSKEVIVSLDGKTVKEEKAEAAK
jgi:uncharacterized membrane protein YkoI